MIYVGEKMIAPEAYRGTHMFKRTGGQTKPAKRNAQGIAASKRLRKREMNLWRRQKDHASTINGLKNGGSKQLSENAYRKPGALRP